MAAAIVEAVAADIKRRRPMTDMKNTPASPTLRRLMGE
jgi:hypothetical protein